MRMVEDWVKRGGVPGQRAEALPVGGVLGVRVTLRLDGVTLGEGTRVRGDLAAALPVDGGAEWLRLPALDLVSLVEPATAEALDGALEAVQRRNLEARIRAAGTGDASRARGRVTAAELGPELEVDLQIALRPQRIVLAADDADDLLYARFAPGFHGLLTLPTPGGGGPAAAETPVWPATALAQNASPRRQVVRLLTRSGLAADDATKLGRPDGLPLGRFEVIHLVRPMRDLPVMRLIRGGQELPSRFVNRQTLIDMSDRIGFHLYGRFIGNGRVRGPYLPARGVYQPAFAEDREAALASYTLARFAQRKREDGNNDKFFDAYFDAAQRTVEQVVGHLLAPDTEPDAVTAAFCLLTILETPAGQFDPALEPRVGQMLRNLFNENGLLLAAADQPDRVLPPASAAAVLAAMARWYDQTRDPETAQQLARGFEALWQQTDGRFDVNALPWITLAHVLSRGWLVDANLVEPAVVEQRGADLAEMIQLVGELQVVERPQLGPTDVMGGILLVPAPEGSPPNPAWQTASLLSFLATALRDEQIVPPLQRPGTLVTASATARFMGQLMIDETACFGIRSPPEALGGIRLSLWDNALDIAPSAITLMALLEMRDTLDVLGQNENPENQP